MPVGGATTLAGDAVLHSAGSSYEAQGEEDDAGHFFCWFFWLFFKRAAVLLQSRKEVVLKTFGPDALYTK